MDLFLDVAIAIFAGLMFTRVFRVLHLNFPDVTAFLIAGLLIGPYGVGKLGIEGLGFPSYASVGKVTAVSTVALAFIAFSIGSEFRLKDLKKTGKQAFVIGVFQAVAATILVDAGLIFLRSFLGENVLPLSACITLGAIASATAPAATLMVVRQYKADGPLTKLLLPIVALDDAVGLIVFAVSFGIARAVSGGALDVISIVVNPFLEIVCSLALGTGLGFVMAKLETLFLSRNNRLSMTISFVFLVIAICFLDIKLGPVTISFSSLLVCMMMGTVFCNISQFSENVMYLAGRWTAPLNACFFVISGAELDLGVFASMATVAIGVSYIVLRSLGKYYGANLSAKATNCSTNIVKYLGITLLPQAGVALGMSSQAMVLGETPGSLVRNITLFSVLIYELFGPLLTKRALTAAGEITEKPEEKKTLDRFKNQTPQNS